MFWTIVRKEILENISGLKFQVVMLFSCLLIVFSVYIGIESYKGRLGDAVSRIKADLIIIGILTVIFFVGAHLSFLQYDASR